MINVKRKRKNDGMHVEVRGSAEELLDELSHAAYVAACGMMGAKDNRIERTKAALFAMALCEGIDLAYRQITGDRRGFMDELERMILLKMTNPDKLSNDVDAILAKEEVLQ